MTAARKEFLGLKYLDLTTTDAVAASADDNIEITPPDGQIYELIDLSVNIPDPAGSSAGTHTLTIATLGIFSTLNGKLSGKSTTGNYIKMGDYYGITADNSELPSDTSDQLNWFNGKIWASPSYTMKIRYSNDTDVQQAGTRTMKFLFKVYSGVEL